MTTYKNPEFDQEIRSLGLALDKTVGASEKKQTSATVDAITWKHECFGSLSLSVQGFEMGSSQMGKTAMWAPIIYHGTRMPKFFLSLSATPATGIELLHAAAGKVTDVTGETIPPLQVSTIWSDRDGCYVPHTREKDKDNIDLVFLDAQGMFIQLQISIVSRSGTFWVAVQEIYTGQVVRIAPTKVAQLKQDGVTCVQAGPHTVLVSPISRENAFPGSDYLNTFQRMGPPIVTYAVAADRSVASSECAVAEWNPQWPALPERMQKNGWKPAVVRYFNLVLGTGFVQLEDGTACFVHFKSIQDKEGRPISVKGEFPVLLPMSGIAVRCKQSDRGLQAVAVRTTAEFIS